MGDICKIDTPADQSLRLVAFVILVLPCIDTLIKKTKSRLISLGDIKFVVIDIAIRRNPLFMNE